jgi:ADP-ribosyl-[dinitrogen reductase] hydrolase
MHSYDHATQQEGLTPLNPHKPRLVLERLHGLIVGLALGDSLGLAVETLSHVEIANRFGKIRTFLDLRNNSLLEGISVPSGTYSDDAQLTAAMFEAYTTASGFSLHEIGKAHLRAYEESSLGWGGSTRKGIEALKAGLTPDTPEFNQRLGKGQGNGIPMKIAAVGAWCVARGISPFEAVGDVQKVCALSHPTSVSVSAGAAHVAGIHYCLTHSSETFSSVEFLEQVTKASAFGRGYYRDTLSDEDLTTRLGGVGEVAMEGTQAIIDTYGGGDCYVYNSLPFAYAFFLKNPTNTEQLYEVIEAGGDTDSNAAIVGTLQGALLGPSVFPSHLVAQIVGMRKLIDVVDQFHKTFT